MKFRDLSPLAVGAVALLIAGSSANAAITVLGSSQAHDCYVAAEFGMAPEDGIAICNTALNGAAMSIDDEAATYVNRGILKSRDDDPHGALDDYNRGLSLDARLGEGYVDRGATLIVLKNYSAALADINKGIAIGAKRPEIAYYDRAIVDEALGNIRGAYEDYHEAVRLQPDFPLAVQALTRFKVIRRPSSGT
jgi:tetratricopeptide (TPR) repeat protein